MASKYFEEKVKHQKEIEKLQERIIYFTSIGSLIGCAIGIFSGYVIAKTETPKNNQTTIQKISSQKDLSIKQAIQNQQQHQ